MKKPQQKQQGMKLISIDPYQKEALKFIQRNYKYIHSSHQFNNEKECPPSNTFVSRFMKKLKSSKVIYNFKLSLAHQSTTSRSFNEELLASIYKKHGKSLKSAQLIVPTISKFPKAFQQLKSVQEISLVDKFFDVNAVLPQAEKLTFHLLESPENLFKLSRLLDQANPINTLRLVTSSWMLAESGGDILKQGLNQVFQRSSQKFLELLIVIHDDTNKTMDIEIEDILKEYGEKHLKHLSLLKSFSNHLGENIFTKNITFRNLESLRLEFDSHSKHTLMTFLMNFEDDSKFEKLKFLEIMFPMNDDKKLCQSIFENFRLPSSLVGLKIKLRTNFSSLVVKNKETLVLFERENKIDDSVNFFEDEPLCIPFFKSLERANGLKYLDLDFSFSELFVSPFTNFISSILKRVLNAETIKIWAYEKDITINPDSNAEENGENCINLPLLFDCCPNLQNLKILDLSMPNYHFGYTNLLQKFPKLHTFILGTQETLFFEKISQQIDRLIKSLIINDLRVLDMEFTETLTLGSLVKRFSSFKKFNNLQFLSARYKVTKIDADGIRNLGHAIQSLKNLQLLYLVFENFENDFKFLSPYIKYHHSLKDSNLCFIA